MDKHDARAILEMAKAIVKANRSARSALGIVREAHPLAGRCIDEVELYGRPPPSQEEEDDDD